MYPRAIKNDAYRLLKVGGWLENSCRVIFTQILPNKKARRIILAGFF
jgi:hypothetical protein